MYLPGLELFGSNLVGGFRNIGLDYVTRSIHGNVDPVLKGTFLWFSLFLILEHFLLHDAQSAR